MLATCFNNEAVPLYSNPPLAATDELPCCSIETCIADQLDPPTLPHPRPLNFPNRPRALAFGMLGFWAGNQINRFHCAVRMSPHPLSPQKQPMPPSSLRQFWPPLGASSVCASFVMAICINKSLAQPVGTGFGWTGWQRGIEGGSKGSVRGIRSVSERRLCE